MGKVTQSLACELFEVDTLAELAGLNAPINDWAFVKETQTWKRRAPGAWTAGSTPGSFADTTPNMTSHAVPIGEVVWRADNISPAITYGSGTWIPVTLKHGGGGQNHTTYVEGHIDESATIWAWIRTA